MTMGEILSDVYNLGGDCVDKEYAIAEALTQISALIEGAIGEDRQYLKLTECPVCGQYQYSCSCDTAESKLRQEIKDNLKKIGLIL